MHERTHTHVCVRTCVYVCVCVCSHSDVPGGDGPRGVRGEVNVAHVHVQQVAVVRVRQRRPARAARALRERQHLLARAHLLLRCNANLAVSHALRGVGSLFRLYSIFFYLSKIINTYILSEYNRTKLLKLV